MTDMTPQELWAMFRRKRRLFAWVAGGVLLLALLLALSWSRYRAVATVEIVTPSIPTSTTVLSASVFDASDALVDRRVNKLLQRVMTAESLKPLLLEEGAVKADDDAPTLEKRAAAMRQRVRLQFVRSEVANPNAQMKETLGQLSAMAFTLKYTDHSPEAAQRVLARLLERMLEEDKHQRIAEAKDTADFLDQEGKRLEGDIAEQEAKVAAFRAQYGDAGPAAQMFNQQASMSSSMSLQSVESQLNALEASLGTLRGQLASTPPYLGVMEDGKTVATAGATLKSLESEYATLSGHYGPDHPDVLKLKRQIAALRKSGKGSPSAKVVRDADNPAYVQLSAALTAAEAQQHALAEQREALRAQAEKFQRAIAENPQTEQQLSQLTLDLANAKERYRAIQDKKLAAEMRVTLESGERGEQLRVIEPPLLPEGTAPARLLLLLAGGILALFSGVVAVVLRELLTRSVRSIEQVEAILGVAPLVEIPYLRAGDQA